MAGWLAGRIARWSDGKMLAGLLARSLGLLSSRQASRMNFCVVASGELSQGLFYRCESLLVYAVSRPETSMERFEKLLLAEIVSVF